MNKKIFLYIMLYLTYSLLENAHIFACNVPVFRYALERWTADPYRLIIYHKGSLEADQVTFLTELKQNSFEGDSTLNLIIQLSDLNKTDQNPFQDHNGNLSYPLMVLYYPAQTLIEYPAWYGDLSKSNVALLKDSPVRNEISRQLLEGETAVFLFLESGDLNADQKYLNILQDEIKRLSKILRIPTTGVDTDGNSIEVTDFQDVNINFSVIRISRQDPAEAIFIKMLLGTEFDLINYKTPLVFPIFGQGRALYALVGMGIKSKTIEKACKSLVDWCSCEIKALHQGVDLLFLADWSNRFGGTWVKDEELPALTGLSNFVPPTPNTGNLKEDSNRLQIRTNTGNDSISRESLESENIDSVLHADIKNTTNDSFSISRNLLIILSVLLVAVVIGSLVIKSRTKQL
jgi:hypothetical protein